MNLKPLFSAVVLVGALVAVISPRAPYVTVADASAGPRDCHGQCDDQRAECEKHAQRDEEHARCSKDKADCDKACDHR